MRLPKANEMRKLLIFAVMVCVAMMSWGISYADEDPKPRACEVPSSAVKITVKQEGDSPVYEYTVTNNYIEPLYIINLGVSPEGWLSIFFDELRPVRYVYPEGWEGVTAGLEGGVLSYLFSIDFNRKDFAKLEIQPGATLSGFKLVMPQPLELMKDLPFSAGFSGGECSYGTVTEEK